MHDPPHRAEQADVGADRAGRGEERQVALEEIHLALEGGAHRAARAVDHVAGVGVGAFLAAQLGELAEARLEDALQVADRVAVVDRALVERVQVAAAPELALEQLGLPPGAADREPLLEDEHPRHEGHREQHQHDHLDDDARVDDQRPDFEVLGQVHLSACASSSASLAGSRAGFMRSRSTSASVTSASTSSCAARSTRWRNTMLARPILTTSALTASMSFSRAGWWYLAAISKTRNRIRSSSATRARSMCAALS